jgi:Ca2+:H+ antiporter
VAARTGDAVGGLLNATLGNLTELVIALTALQAGQHLLVKASIAGAIVTNTLFMLGGAFLLGGLRHHVQTFNRTSARLQASLLFLATVGLLVPSLISSADHVVEGPLIGQLNAGLAVLLILGYGMAMLFSLGTHKEMFGSEGHGGEEEAPWPMPVALATLAVVTLLVALVGGAAEMTTAFAAARRDRLDLSVGIALGSAAQIALFVAPVLVLLSYVIGPAPMDLLFWPGAVVMVLIATMTATLATNGGHSAWFIGVMLLMVYAFFGLTLFLLPPE